MTPHGGYRPGSGRKRKPDKLVIVTARVQPEVASHLANVGGGNVSAGVRLLAAASWRAAVDRLRRKGK